MKNCSELGRGILFGPLFLLRFSFVCFTLLSLVWFSFLLAKWLPIFALFLNSFFLISFEFFSYFSLLLRFTLYYPFINKVIKLVQEQVLEIKSSNHLLVIHLVLGKRIYVLKLDTFFCCIFLNDCSQFYH